MLKYFKAVILPIYTPIRHPFKTFQSYLNIEAEWLQFKNAIKPHRMKILFLFGVITFPLYRDIFPIIKANTYKSI